MYVVVHVRRFDLAHLRGSAARLLEGLHELAERATACGLEDLLPLVGGEDPLPPLGRAFLMCLSGLGARMPSASAS